MNRSTFINQLTKGLKEMGILDIEEIVKDYDSHFDNELKKGRTEDEVSKALGKIDDILLDFKPDYHLKKEKRLMSKYSILTSDLFIYTGMFSLYLVNLVIISLSLVSLLLAIYITFMMDFLVFIPVMVFPFSLFLGLSFLSLAVLSFSMAVLLFKYLNILMKRLGLWHKQVLKGQYLHQFIAVKQSKVMKMMCLWSSISFILFFIITFILGVTMTGNPQFWEYWNWFN